jgi:hypothetical protein
MCFELGALVCESTQRKFDVLHPRRDRHLHLFIFMLMIVMVIAMAVIMMTYRCGGAGAEDLLGRIS